MQSNSADSERQRSSTLVKKLEDLAIAKRLGISSTVFWAISDQFVASAGNFIVAVAAARLLDVAEFGTFAVVLVLASFILGMQEAIVSIPMMTLSGRRAKRTPRYYSAIMLWNTILSLFGGLIVALCLVVMYSFRDGSISFAFVVAAVGCTAFQNFQCVTRRVLFVHNKGLRAFAIDASRYLTLFVILAFWNEVFEVSAAALLTCLGVTALLATMPFLPSLARGRVRMALLKRVWTRHWPFARHLMLADLLSCGEEPVVMMATAGLVGDRAAGGLRAGQSLVSASLIILRALENFVPVGAARAYSYHGLAELKRYLIRRKLVFGGLVGALVLAVALPAEFWLRVVLGGDYVEFAPVLRIYALAYLLMPVRDIWTCYLRTIERTDLILKAYGASFVMTMLLFYPAITSWGIIGGALVILVGTLVSTGSIVIFVIVHQSRVRECAPK